MATQLSNTTRSRKWFGTVWTQADLNAVTKLKYKYIIVSALDTTTESHDGRQSNHWHVFIQFSSNRTRPATSTAHWEIPSSISGAIQYCRSKGDPVLEAGDIGLDTCVKADWDSFVKVIQVKPKEALYDSPFSKYIARYPKFADDVYSVFNQRPMINGQLHNLWIYGDAGCGKTSWVYQHFGSQLYPKNPNKWWDSYKDQRIVLIDDWDPQHKVLTHHLKRWADRYPFIGETKGSGRIIRPDVIIVTSNYSIEECFDRADVEAMYRRFTIICGRPSDDFTSEYSLILGHRGNTGTLLTEHRSQSPRPDPNPIPDEILFMADMAQQF